MSEKTNAAFSNEHFKEYCLKMIGQPYWYGCCGYKATTSLLSRKANQYASHYGSSRTARYKQDISAKKVVCDCIGGAKGYAWTDGGQPMLEVIGRDGSVANRYGANGCPDKSANGMFSYAKSKGMDWGAIDTLPEIVGLALHKDGHIGYYVGGGYAVEWRGFSYGCVKTKLTARSWKYWYRLPFIDYGENTGITNPPTIKITLGSRLLRKGSVGADVKAMQELLMQRGYPLPKYGADCDFGAETEKALKAFQKDEGLEIDGKYGERTHAALMDAVQDPDDSEDDAAAAEHPDEPVVPKPLGSTVVIVSGGGNVNIRSGNGTDYARITCVAPGMTYEYVATAANGWHAIVVGAKVGWVYGEYARQI